MVENFSAKSSKDIPINVGQAKLDVPVLLQGGKFGHGFVSAGFTEALSPAVGQMGDNRNFGTVLAKTAVSAAIGGTASKLSGGNFANGAATGAFQQLFNHTVSEVRKQFEEAKTQARQDGLNKASEYFGEYQPGDGAPHFYEIGPTMLCSQGSSWCTLAGVTFTIDGNAVPFTTGTGEGRYDLPFGMGIDPVTHDRPEAGVWLNITEPGHRYHSGRVIHVLVNRNKVFLLYSVGIGSGPNPAANESQGRWIFGNTHSKIQNSIRISGGGQ